MVYDFLGREVSLGADMLEESILGMRELSKDTIDTAIDIELSLLVNRRHILQIVILLGPSVDSKVE